MSDRRPRPAPAHPSKKGVSKGTTLKMKNGETWTHLLFRNYKASKA